MSLNQTTILAEQFNLLNWWSTKAVDTENGGFWGEIDANDVPIKDAPKSAIQNTRLLWYFSAMARVHQSDEALLLAHRAANYIRSHFLDPDHGGIYWMLDHKGQVIDAKKQAYAQAFAIFAFAEYYRVTKDLACAKIALGFQRDIEERFWDPKFGGYVEAMSAFWMDAGDQRLSDKDADCPKSMNTHLHILEAYTTLHRAARDETTHAALYRALQIFLDHFFTDDNRHLRLFFEMDWTDRTEAASFGHDIEASWLVWEAAHVLGEPDLIARAEPLCLSLAESTLKEGINVSGGVAYEKGFDGHFDPDGEWWCQAEGMVGFVNAFEISGDTKFLTAANKIWDYAEAQFGAGQGGEWSWYPANAQGQRTRYKAGQWKCPYHNGRALMELSSRLMPMPSHL